MASVDIEISREDHWGGQDAQLVSLTGRLFIYKSCVPFGMN